MRRIALSLVLAATSASACSTERDQARPLASPTSAASALKLPSPESFSKQHASFDRYWYRGLAELAGYAKPDTESNMKARPF